MRYNKLDSGSLLELLLHLRSGLFQTLTLSFVKFRAASFPMVFVRFEHCHSMTARIANKEVLLVSG